MSPHNIYHCWAPPESIWSDWAKPVLFSDLTDDSTFLPQPTSPFSPTLEFLPAAEHNFAIIIDLPGVRSLQMGMLLAEHGYRPVPLYNAAPPPCDVLSTAVVDVSRIREGLRNHALTLQALNLVPHAPPCFLLDSLRRTGGRSATPGKFDNRWVTFPEDYPSANFLLSKKIQGIIVVEEDYVEPSDDLRHVLVRWQEAGLTIYLNPLSRREPPIAVTITKPSSFGSLWYRLMCVLGLRRNSAGGFGGIVPEPSQSTG